MWLERADLTCTQVERRLEDEIVVDTVEQSLQVGSFFLLCNSLF